MTTYSIKLDDVDLALLPLRSSYNNFLKKEYCQFEVMKTVKFEVPEPRLLYTCHICAIDMPAEFAGEHATSIKHRANTRIASIAAQRMCAHISALPPPCAQPTARYCANCATVADDDHYNTREHQDAVAHDNLLWDLVKAYAKDDDANYDSELSNNHGNQKKDIDENMHTKDDVEFKKGNSNNKYNNVANPLDNNKLTKSKDVEKQIEPTREEHSANNSQMNNNTDQNKVDHEFTDDINGNINTSGNNTEVNDVTVKSDILVEYPYELTSTGQIQCVVCKCQVPRGLRQRKEHVKGLRHRRKVLIQNQQKEHKESGDTKEELEDSCDDSDATDTLEEYSEGAEFVDIITDNRSTEINSSNDNAFTMQPSDLKLYTQIAAPHKIKDPGHVWCDVCNFRNRIKRATRHEEKSVEGCDSFEEYSEDKEFYITENNSMNINIEKDCEVNDTPEAYSEDEELADINTDNRSTKISRSNDSAVTMKPSDFKVDTPTAYPDKIKDTGRVCCDVCNFRNRIKRETRHEKKEENAVEACDSFEEYSEDEEFYNIENNSMSSNRNMEEDETVGEDCVTNNILEEYSEDEEFYSNENNNMSSNITEASYVNTIANSHIEYPLEVTATGHIRCVVCDCKVPNHENNRNEHINGWRHRHMMNRATEQMEEDKTVEKDCEEYTEECEDEELEDETVAEDCETNDSFEEYSEECEDEELYNNENDGIINSITEANGNTIDNAHIEYPLEVTATGHIRCVVCKCKVPNHENNRNEHINGWRHRHMMNRATEQMEEDKTVEKDCEEYTEECEDEELEDETVAEDCETNDSFEEYSKECEDEELYNNENDGIINSISEANGNTIDNADIEYPLEVTATGHIRCVVCKCKVPNHENNRNEHINGWRHRHMINRATEHMEEATIAEECETNDSFEEYSEECEHEQLEDETVAEDCETNDSFEEYSEECEDEEFYNNDNDSIINSITEANENTIANTQNEYPFEVTATGHIRCVVCECKVPNYENDRNEHISGWRHRHMVMKINRLEEPIEEEEENVENIEDNSFEEYSDEEEITDDNAGNNNISDGYITVNSQIEYPYQVTVTGHVVRCVICDCQVPSGVQNREEHINGMRHRVSQLLI